MSISAQSAAAQRIIAHRGASRDAPENTLAAFRLAWEQGADGIEGDFMLTKDGQIVCIHDKDTKRTGNQTLIVAQSTLEQLRAVDVGRWKGEPFAGEGIPTLAEVLATVPEGKEIFIEIKCGPEIVPVLAREVKKAGLLSSQMAIIAFDDKVIHACRQQLPELRAYWITSFKQNRITGVWRPSLHTSLATLKRIGATGIDVNANDKVIDAAWIKALSDGGYELHCWTVNDADLARKFQALGAQSITTDRPGFLRKELRGESQ